MDRSLWRRMVTAATLALLALSVSVTSVLAGVGAGPWP